MTGVSYAKSFTFTYPLTARVVGAPQMISQTNFLHLFFSVLRSPLGLGELQACLFPDAVFPPPFFSVLHSPLGLGQLQARPFPDAVFPPLGNFSQPGVFSCQHCGE